MIEGMGQKCIYNVTKDRGQLYIFWDYMFEYRQCLNEEIKNLRSYEFCVGRAYTNSGITGELKEKVFSCLRESFENNSDSVYKENYILKKDFEHNSNFNGTETPKLFIDGRVVNEEFTFAAMVGRVCDKIETNLSTCLDVYTDTINAYPNDVNDDTMFEIKEDNVIYDDPVSEEPVEEVIEEPMPEDYEEPVPETVEPEPEIVVCEAPEEEEENVFRHKECPFSSVVTYVAFGFVSAFIYMLTRLG